MAVKYNAVPTEDLESVKIDFSSPFDYRSSVSYGGKGDYRSAFSYGKHHAGSTVETEYKESRWSSICATVITALCVLFIIITFPITGWFCIKVVQQNDKLVVFRLGRLQRPAKGPGMVFIIPCLDKCVTVDTRTRAFNVPPQKVFTVDGAVIEMGADVYYQICDPTLSVISTQDLNQAARVIAQTSLLNYLAKFKLSEIETGKTSISIALQGEICQSTIPWGIQVIKLELSQIKILEKDSPLVGGHDGMTTITQVIKQLFPHIMPEQSPTPQLVSAFKSSNQTQLGHQTSNEESLIDLSSQTRSPGGGQTIPAALTPRQLIDVIRLLINDSLVRNVDAVYQFEINGEGGGTFYLNLKYGNGSVGEGLPPGGRSDAIISISVQDMQSLFFGDIKPMQAYISGLLRVSGDLSAAMRLEHVINRLTGR